MKVAMVSEHASPLAVLGGEDAGGQNVHVAALAMAVARQGNPVTVYTRRDDPTLARRCPLAPGVMVEHIEAGPPVPIAKDELLPHMDQFALGLIDAWERRRPDLVHAHFWMSGRASREAGEATGLPVVQTFHALGVVKRRHQGSRDTSPPARDAIERTLVCSVDHIVATSTDEVFELRRLGADPGRISVVPCGVDVDAFTPVGAAAHRTAGMRRVVVVTRLVERKGVDDVIRAMRALPDAELLVAGGPSRDRIEQHPEGARLLAIARTERVADRVHLLGRIPHGAVPSLMRSADVVVSVPWYEPFGIVPLEAMACGVPVVVSAVGGMVDTVVHGTTGLHVPPQAPTEVAAAVRALLDDDELRARLGQGGAARARARYTWPKVARATVDCYASVTRRRVAHAGDAIR